MDYMMEQDKEKNNKMTELPNINYSATVDEGLGFFYKVEVFDDFTALGAVAFCAIAFCLAFLDSPPEFIFKLLCFSFNIFNFFFFINFLII